MTKFVRLAALAAVATVAAAPALAAVPATPVAKARVNIVKPLTLAATRDLHFGTIVVTGDDSVSIDGSGNVTCGAAVNVTCNTTGAQSAQVHVTGSNNQVVKVNVAGSNLTLFGGTATLAFTPTAPATVPLPNSGANGADFNVGGSVAVLASAPEGLYVGDINVTVEY